MIGRYYAPALAARSAGLCPIPVASNGTKGPGLQTWRRYIFGRDEFTGELPSPAELVEWFKQSSPNGLGLVCGRISGGLEMLEVEGRYVERWPEVRQALDDAGLGELWERIDAGYRELTPSGGFHWLYRCSEIEGNRKLAQRPDPNRANGRLVLIETRGEGGFVVCAPTAGVFDDYPAGAHWSIQRGGYQSVTTITPAERVELFRLLATFDEMPEPETVPAAPTSLERRHSGQLDDDNRPGDEYNRSTAWPDLLMPDGWQVAFTRGEVTYWRRPGKTEGVSATTNALGTDRLKVFSTSTVFDADRTYDRFGAYAVLRHGGDLQAAARTLRPATSLPAPKPRTVLDGPKVADDGFGDTEAAWEPPEKLLAEFLAEPEQPHDWLIEDLIERGDRLILTAPEGLGKSTLLRQIAAAVSIGQHPFTCQPLEAPLKSLVVDLENSRRHVRRQLGAFRHAAQGRLWVAVWPSGIDLLTPEDQGWLEGMIDRQRPDIVTIGPVYKMHSGEEKDDVSAKRTAFVLDELRARYGFAVLLEHHQPYGEGSKRPIRPIGSSVWSRWPEFGLALVGSPDEPEVEIKRWRGDRDARKWPARLRKHGEPWPFVDASSDRIITTYPAIKEHALGIFEAIKAHGMKRRPTPEELAVATRFPLHEIKQALRNNDRDWQAYCLLHDFDDINDTF